MTTLDTLPWEDILFPRLLPYLTIKDLYNFQFVCKKYLEIYKRYLVIMKTLDLSIKPDISPEYFRKVSIF